MYLFMNNTLSVIPNFASIEIFMSHDCFSLTLFYFCLCISAGFHLVFLYLS